MTTKWIIENLVKDPSYQEMIDEVVKQNMPLTTIPGAHLDHLKSYKDDNNPIPTCVIFLGSIEMTDIVQKDLPHCYPVAFCTQENYKCTKYMSHYGKYLFNDKYTIMSLSELQRQKFFVYGTYGKEAMIFIRPDSGRKPFQAQLLDMLDIDRFVRNNDHIKHELVVVSTPKSINWEGRFIVSKSHGIIAHSTYQYQGQVTKIQPVPPEAMVFCQSMLDIGYYPDPVFCIDVCQDAAGDFWLLELNSFSSAGMYACDKAAIVKTVSEIVYAEYTKYLTKLPKHNTI